MAVGAEVADALAWIQATLGADAALTAAAPGGMWRGMAPDGTVTPYVVVAFMAGTDAAGVAAIRLFTTGTYLVKAVGPTSVPGGFAGLVAAAARVDALLHRQSGPGVLSSVRVGPAPPIDELVGGTPWASLGALYHIISQ